MTINVAKFSFKKEFFIEIYEYFNYRDFSRILTAFFHLL